ncbi:MULTISPECIES: hypothetical protein [Mycobacteriaceae]|jgi:hypothetical protein|uniref:Uncharacterized protein n=3 Tax=Mycobacteriaceae TaxID=1762 RepID=A0ABR5FMI2_9MYCO|nr:MULTISPECIES: hypothetical protein [Mycobacteriaceae]KLI09258.1 hypothetical protein AA982_04120 [Mycolicibacterium senegalense]KLO47650.1 hypothetical protein ABW05_31140 [Mycolicibacterium senegalense]MBP2451939.1 hypothetical protein [Mycolicibacterium lutetiense]OHT97133.1 hypothetical protein BKG61_17915 [Mycobacterium syngnathidarum]OMB76654.1 hypothetical protein A5741_31755 [Mycolicibacterium conceptionense]
MDIPDSIIDPATADPDVWAYIVALDDDDWDHWGSPSQIAKYNGCRRSTGRWNLRDVVTGAPVDWDYADDEVVVLRVLS